MDKQQYDDDFKELGYVPSLFIRVPLPYDDPKSNIYKKKYGIYDLIFSNPFRNLPFGKLPRSLLCLITTQFILQHKEIKDEKKQRLINLDTLSKTAEQLGMGKNLTGGVKGSRTRLFDAMDGLRSMMIHTSSEYLIKTYGIDRRMNTPIFERSQIFWSKAKPDMNHVQLDLFGNWVLISTQFRDILIDHSVPVDIFVYNSFDNARYQDIYAWSVKRLFDIKEHNEKGKEISYDKILPQFFEPSTDRKLKSKRIGHLKDAFFEITKVYPEARIKTDKNGILLLPSRLHIDKNHVGYV